MSSLNIATRALTTNLAALQVVGHNIANVNTAGYSRQTLQMSSVEGQRMGNAYFGKGVEIAEVTRAYDELLTREAQVTQSVASSDAVLYQRLKQLEDLFPMGETGLGATLNSALNAWVDVASSPTDLTARTVVLTRSEDFTQRLNNVTKSLDELRTSSLEQVNATLTSINTLAQNIAGLNLRIIEGTGAGKVPNDLLDQRDQMVNELSKYVQTTSVVSDNGSMTVFIGGSLPLVLAGQAYELARADKINPPPADAPLDPMQVGIVLNREGQPYAIDESLLRGGELEGLVRFVNHDISDTTNLLGRMALSTAMQMNEQHRLGLDLNGQPGGNLFSMDGGYLSVNATTNAVTINALKSRSGAPDMGVTVSDPTALIASNYEVRFTAAGEGSILRLSDGKTTAFNASTPLPLEVDGLTFDMPGAPTAGDTYLVKPFADASRNIGVAVSKPEGLAAASPLLAVFDSGNLGGLGLENLSAHTVGPHSAVEFRYNDANGAFDVYDISTGNLMVYDSATHSFSAATTETTSGWTAYAPGQPLTFTSGTSSWSVTLRGIPSDADSVVIRPPNSTESMRQNAGNAQALLALRDMPSYEGVSLSDGYISVFSEVAAKVQAGRFAAEFSETKAVSAETARANVAGVNLDEEAARLLQYQQSYQAAAKFLQTVQSTFDTLIASFGR